MQKTQERTEIGKRGGMVGEKNPERGRWRATGRQIRKLVG